MASFSIKEQLPNFNAFQSKIEQYQIANHAQLFCRDSRSVAAAASRCPNKTFNPTLKYSELSYSCIHGGKNFESVGTGKVSQRSWLLLYAIYYSVGALVFAIYRLEDFDGSIPFNFLVWVDFGNCCAYSSQQMVNMISMFVTFIITGAVYGFYINNRVWDYAVTISILHSFASCFVMLNFPLNWSWWVCLGISCLLMTGCGEGISFLWRYRDRQRQVKPELATERDITGSYLHKTKSKR